MAFNINKVKISGAVNTRDEFLSVPGGDTSAFSATPPGYAFAYDSSAGGWYGYNGSSWSAVTGSSAAADAVYNAGAWSVAVDANDVDFLMDGDYEFLVANNKAATQAVGIKVDAKNASASCVITDAFTVTTSGASATVTDALDVSDAGITNAINIGGNAVAGTNFSVTAAGVITCTGITGAGSWNIGADGTGHDFYIYSDTVGDWVFFDDTNKCAQFIDYNIHMDDSDEIHFGAGSGIGSGDFKMDSDGGHLYIRANAEVEGQALKIGGNTNELDIEWLGTTAGAEVLFDSSGDMVVLDGIDLRFDDGDYALFGSDSDFTITYTSPDLVIAAGADVADQAVKIGGATDDIDVFVYGKTSGDYLQFDSSADQLKLIDINLVATESGNTSALDITGAATGVHVVEINSTGALTDGLSGLGVLGIGDIATGGCVALLSYSTGTPHADARILELAGAGKAIRGVYADVDSTQDCYHFHCGGATASGEAVFSITSDGTIASGASGLLEVIFTGDDANEPILCNLAGTGTGINAGGLYVATESDGVSCFHVKLVDAKDGAVGCVIYGHQDSASPAVNDACLSIQGVGEDSGSAATIYAQLDFGIMLTTAGQEDGQLKVSCAAHDGSMTEIAQFSPRAGGALGQLSLGAGAGAGYLTTNGAYSLVLDTNVGGTGASVTIESGTNSDVILTPSGTGEVLLTLGELSTVGAIDLVLDTNEGTNSGSITIADGVDGDITLVGNGAGSVVLSGAGVQYQARDIAAGVLTDTADTTDGLIQISTNGANNCVATVPEAASNLGLVLTYQHDADGGKDVVVTRTGADTFDEDADAGNVTFTMANAGECIQLMAVSDNQWMILSRVGGTLV